MNTKFNMDRCGYELYHLMSTPPSYNSMTKIIPLLKEFDRKYKNILISYFKLISDCFEKYKQIYPDHKITALEGEFRLPPQKLITSCKVSGIFQEYFDAISENFNHIINQAYRSQLIFVQVLNEINPHPKITSANQSLERLDKERDLYSLIFTFKKWTISNLPSVLDEIKHLGYLKLARTFHETCIKSLNKRESVPLEGTELFIRTQHHQTKLSQISFSSEHMPISDTYIIKCQNHIKKIYAKEELFPEEKNFYRKFMLNHSIKQIDSYLKKSAVLGWLTKHLDSLRKNLEKEQELIDENFGIVSSERESFLMDCAKYFHNKFLNEKVKSILNSLQNRSEVCSRKINFLRNALKNITVSPVFEKIGDGLYKEERLEYLDCIGDAFLSIGTYVPKGEDPSSLLSAETEKRKEVSKTKFFTTKEEYQKTISEIVKLEILSEDNYIRMNGVMLSCKAAYKVFYSYNRNETDLLLQEESFYSLFCAQEICWLNWTQSNPKMIQSRTESQMPHQQIELPVDDHMAIICSKPLPQFSEKKMPLIRAVSFEIDL